MAGEDQATHSANQLRAAEDKVNQTIAEHGKRAGQAEGFRQGKAAVAEAQAKTAVARATKLTAAYDDFLEKAKADPRAYPADVRDRVNVARQAIVNLTKEAEKTADPLHAQYLHSITADMEKYADPRQYAGQKLTHVIGTNEGEITRLAHGEDVGGGKTPGGQFRSLKSEHYRQGIETNFSRPGVMQLESKFWNERATNATVNEVDRRLGSTVGDKLGSLPEGMKGRDLYAALDKAGLRPWDPTAGITGNIHVPVDRITEATRVLPTPVFEAVDRQFAGNERPIGTVHAIAQTAGAATTG